MRSGWTTKPIWLLCAVLWQWVVLSPAAGAREDQWTFHWKNGFKLSSSDGDFKLAFGGRLNLDFSFADADESVEGFLGEIEDSSEIRRGRIFFSGTFHKKIEFKSEFDFAGSDTNPTDVYIGILDTPVGNIRIGHFFEPFSIEQHTSSKFITFLERGLPNVFSPARNVGIMFHDTARKNDEGKNGRLMWAIGVFRESDGFALGQGEDRLNVSGRISGLPVFKDGGRRLLHLGLSLSHKDIGGQGFRVRQRPEAHLSPRFVDTGGFLADTADLGAFEVAVNASAFHAQAEYMFSDVDAIALGDVEFTGYYVEAGYFLTGEHKPYKHSQGGFNRVKPKSTFGKDGGRGAWEVALRYSTLDLTDQSIAGGKLDDLTVALNWYMNSQTRAQFNYVMADLQDIGDTDFFLLRFQIDF